MPLKHLLPESQLVFSADLAATAGLEEAVMLQQIHGLYQHQPATRREDLSWLHISEAYLLQLLPFWDAKDIRRICASLEALGLLSIDRRSAEPACLLMAINSRATTAAAQITAPSVSQHQVEPEPQKTTAPRQTQPPQQTPGSAGQGKRVAVHRDPPPRREGQPLPLDFQPSEDNLEILEQFHGIPRNFALQQLEDFTLYWRERGSAAHAWQNKFKQHVQFKWAKHQQDRMGSEHAGQPGTGATRRTRDSSLEQDLTDTSWAD